MFLGCSACISNVLGRCLKFLTIQLLTTITHWPTLWCIINWYDVMFVYFNLGRCKLLDTIAVCLCMHKIRVRQGMRHRSEKWAYPTRQGVWLPLVILKWFWFYSSYELETRYDYPTIILLHSIRIPSPAISCVGVASTHTTHGWKSAVLCLRFDSHHFWQEAIYSFKCGICEAEGLICP